MIKFKNLKSQQGTVDIIFILVILVLAAGLGGFVYYRQQQANKIYNAAGNGVTVAKNTSKKTAPSKATTQPVNTVPSGPGYDAAKQQWVKGSEDIAANQNVYFSNAASSLTAGLKTDRNTSGYAAAISDLKELITIPITDASVTQQSGATADIKALNAFFGTNVYN